MDRTVPLLSGDALSLRDFLIFPFEEVHAFRDLDASLLYQHHRHDCLEIIWITGGSGTVQIDFQHYHYFPNSLCLISPGQVHKWMEFEEDSFKGYLLLFSKEMLADNRAGNLNWPSVSLFHLLGENPFHSISEEQAFFSITYVVCWNGNRRVSINLPGISFRR